MGHLLYITWLRIVKGDNIMAVYINGYSANEVFYNDVSLVGYLFNGVQLLAQTVAFLQGTSTSGQAISGDICLFGGNNPLITSPTVASDGMIPANSTSYGFGISATRPGTTMANAKGICDDAYSGGYYAAAVITDSNAVTVGISITVPFSNYTLVGIGYVQSPIDPKIHYIYIDGSHGTEIPAAYYNAGNCTYMSVNIKVLFVF